ncbi:MAG: hypothetical protein Q9202_001961 [Teloschistes flavicans]
MYLCGKEHEILSSRLQDLSHCQVLPLDILSQGELERFEHNVFEEEEKRERAGEEKRERSKPKLGRPRKRTRTSQPTYKGSEKLETAEKLKKPKRPFGRPRKQPTGRRTRSNFQGVLIQSPLKRGLEVINTSSSSSSDSSPSSSVPSLRSQDMQIPDSNTTLSKIDQLTPSNARRVVGDKSVRAELSRSKAHSRQTSIVEGAFGDGFSNETGSEDELTAASPNVNRHFAHKVKVAPVHDLDNDHEARHTIVDSQRRDTQPSEETVHTTISPRTPASGKDIRKSMTPLIPAYTTSASHFLVQSPSKQIRGGAALPRGLSMMRDQDEILSLLNGERNISVEDHTITLGSPITSSGEEDDPRALQRSISCRPALSTSIAPTSRHRTSHPFEHRKVSRGEPVMTYDERADPSVRSTLPEIVLGRLIARTSDAAEPEHAPPSEARQEPDGLAMKDLQKKRRRSPSVGKEGWYRMVRR